MIEDEALIISDLHLSSRSVDDFMWQLFPQVEACLIQNKINKLFILGDLHEAKAGFSAEFVNRLVDGFVKWTNQASITILSGNHDGISAVKPFFAFLDHLPRVEFITQPTERTICGAQTLWLPHTRQPEIDWKDIDVADKVVFAHITVNKAISETNQSLGGHIDDGFFAKSKITLAGDVHTPGKVGNVEYVGSPYATKIFGANDHRYRGMILNLKTFRTIDVYFQFPRRVSVKVKSMKDFVEQTKSVVKGSQIKIEVVIPVANMGDWKNIRDEIRENVISRGFELVGLKTVKEYNDLNQIKVTEEKVGYSSYTSYCRVNQIDPALISFGNQIIEEAKVYAK